MSKLLSVIIPTIGRPTLDPLIESIPDEDWLEVIVVGDVHKDRDDFTGDVSRAFARLPPRKNVRLLTYDGGTHAWGHPQRNFGMEMAEGEYLMFSQDDNVYAPDAFDTIRRAVWKRLDYKPFLFRVMTWQAGIVWVTRGSLKLGEIDADCIVTPNIPGKLSRWTSIYNGDWEFIRRTIELWDNDVEWRDELIATALPGIERHPE